MLQQAAMLNVQPALKHIRLRWQNWVARGLTRCSPDFVPVIGDRHKLEAAVSLKVLQKLTKLIDGKRSLRDIAVVANKDVLAVACSLVPYLRRQLIALVKCGDLPRPLAKPPAPPVAIAPPPPKPAYQPLVACIDDDPQVMALLEGIIVEKGYRFLDISDPVQALPQLLQHKPDLIILDLVMPVANGYEVCAQVRRIAQFHETPILILTSNDGIVDRVRAKVVGATDFLSKPIDVDKVMGLLQQHCDRQTNTT
ncbi:MAG: response regulator [Spirulinaceae cyanobacterium SM2_1_0]|nr:response regulator [Spirulinaceae cyanobacterium SM2_1_0]